MAQDHEKDPDRKPMTPTGMMPPPPPPPPPPYAYLPPEKPRRTSIAGRIFVSLITALLLTSILLNVYLGMFFAGVTGGVWEATYQDGDEAHRIAVIPIEGAITGWTASFLHDVLDHLSENPPSAIVLRVVSPGGAIGPCDQIWNKLRRFRDHPATSGVPMVASFGSVAASGGYYVSTLADHIMAEPVTITGSIGVMASLYTVNGLLEKIGVTPEVLVAPDSPNKSVANNIMRAWDERDRDKVKQLLDHAHERFVEVVFEGRRHKLESKSAAREVSRGDVYTTDQAIDRLLVDSKGYLEDAIAKAASMAKIDTSIQPRITIFRVPQRFDLYNLLSGRAPALTASTAAALVEQSMAELATPRLMYRMW